MHDIKKFRHSQDKAILKKYRYVHNGEKEYGKENDLNLRRRVALILKLYKNYSVEDKPLIRWLLKQEIKYANEIGASISSIDLCAYMLYKVMSLSDIYLLFKAKFGNNYDNSFWLDVELIFAFDRKETKKHLKACKTKKKKNKEILKMIKWYEKRCKDNPNALKTRPQYIEYYENNKSKKLIGELRDMWDGKSQ